MNLFFARFFLFKNFFQDTLDHTLSLRLRQIDAHNFLSVYLRRFHDLLARATGVAATNVRILSMQNRRELVSNPPLESVFRRRRHSLGNSSNLEFGDLEVLFAIVRGEARGYYRPNYVKQRIENSINEISAEIGLEVSFF